MNERFPVPSVMIACPVEPPVILTLPTSPSVDVFVTDTLANVNVAKVLTLDGCKLVNDMLFPDYYVFMIGEKGNSPNGLFILDEPSNDTVSSTVRDG